MEQNEKNILVRFREIRFSRFIKHNTSYRKFALLVIMSDCKCHEVYGL